MMFLDSHHQPSRFLSMRRFLTTIALTFVSCCFAMHSMAQEPLSVDRSARSNPAPAESRDQINRNVSTEASDQAKQRSGRQRSGGRPGAAVQPNLDNVVVHREIPYVSIPHPRQHLDLYLPKDAAGPLPVVVWIHGGAWYRGDKENCLPMQVGFSAGEFAIASIGYRLSGDATFPAQIEDCKAAIRFLRKNAQHFGLAPDRFGVWGSSAGGHLASLVGTSGGLTQWDVGENLDYSSKVQAVCNFYGPADFVSFASKRDATAGETEKAPESRLFGGTIQTKRKVAIAASPTTHITSGVPPFLIVHGDQDRKVPLKQSEILLDKLQSAGGKGRLVVLQGASHGGPRFAESEVIQQVKVFFQENL